jgi:hypothetical protein
MIARRKFITLVGSASIAALRTLRCCLNASH